MTYRLVAGLGLTVTAAVLIAPAGLKAQNDEKAPSASSSYQSSSQWSWSSSTDAPGRPRTQWQSSSQTNISGVGLLGALHRIARLGPCEILVSDAAFGVLIANEGRISIAARDASQEALLARVLGEVPLVVQREGETLFLMTAAAEENRQFAPIGRVVACEALKKPVAVHVDAAPLWTALLAVEGQISIPVRDRRKADRAWRNEPMVTVHAESRSAWEVLVEIARQTGLAVEVGNGEIVLDHPGAETVAQPQGGRVGVAAPPEA